MIVEYIRYKISPSETLNFLDAYKKGSQQLDSSEHCLGYELTECEEEKGSFILRIEWTSTHDHLNGFRKSALFPEFYKNVKAFFNNIQEMRHYTLTEIVKSK